jgi:hypothetical protein
MSKYKPRAQMPPPPPPNSGYQSLKSTATSGTTETARGPDSTKVQRAGDDNFVPIKPAASRRRRPPKGNSWSKKDVVEIVSLVAVAATVIGAGFTLTYKVGTVGDKVTAVAGDVTTVKEGQITDHAKLEEVRSDVIELRRDVRDAPAAAPRASKSK